MPRDRCSKAPRAIPWETHSYSDWVGGAAIVQALALAGVLGTGPWGITSLSVLAALMGALLIFLLASRENLTPARLALIGVSLGALTLAIAGAILTHARVFSLQALALFSGSLANRSWEDVTPAIPFLALGMVLAVLAAGRLNLLVLGRSSRRAIGSESKEYPANGHGLRRGTCPAPE